MIVADKIFVQLILFLIGFLSLLFSTPVSGQSSLYDPSNPNILTLDSTNFTTTIESQPNAFVVQFYKHWCPYCKRFAPAWRHLAEDIKTWKPVVKLAVINCADEENVATCRSAAIPFVPTIHFYPSYWNFSSGLLPIVVKKGTVDALRNNLTTLIAVTSPKDPDLTLIEPLEHRIFLTNESLGKKVFLIGEKNESKIGSEVILDLYNFKDQLTIKRANWQSPWLDQFQLNETQLPILVTIPKRGFVPIAVHYNQSKNTRKAINDVILGSIQVTINASSSDFTTQASNNVRSGNFSYVNNNQLYIDDLYKCLQQILTNEILIYDTYSLEKINSLRNFTTTIERYFPFANSSERIFFAQLSTLLASHETALLTNVSAGVPVNDLVKQINGLQNDYTLPKPAEWITCRGSSPIYRGYTCSLWLLWHTLTVIEHSTVNGPSTDHQVVFTMRQFITDFFSCEECRAHFINESANISNEIDQSDHFSSIVWLWSIHNSVNRRIAGDPTEDPYFPKVQFPEPSRCMKCYHHGKFNENQVAKFLINRYKPSSWVQYQNPIS